MGAVVASCGRLFHSGMVVGKEIACLYAARWDGIVFKWIPNFLKRNNKSLNVSLEKRSPGR